LGRSKSMMFEFGIAGVAIRPWQYLGAIARIKAIAPNYGNWRAMYGDDSLDRGIAGLALWPAATQ
jgi:hypothetical protein